MKAIERSNEDQPKAILMSLLFHAALITVLFLYHFSAPEPITETPAIVLEWGGGGDDAARGMPDRGQGNAPASGEQMEAPSTPEPVSKPATAVTQPAKPSSGAPSKPVATSSDPTAAALQQAEAKRKAQEQENLRKQQEIERQRKEKSNALGGAFNTQGPGSGNSNTPGNGGTPNGNGNNPNGTSPGSGGGSGGGSGTGTGVSIGGGLGGRKVTYQPRMVDNSQKSGKVMVEVCVDGQGRVISAVYTMKGSTTNDSELRNKAEQWAKQYKFVPSGNEKECGTFAFNFQLQ